MWTHKYLRTCEFLTHGSESPSGWNPHRSRYGILNLDTRGYGSVSPMSALVGDPDPYPWVFQIQNAIPGSVRVSATGWLGAVSQKLMGQQVLESTDKYSGYYSYLWNIHRMRKFPISDWFHEIHRSSLNTCPICIILSAFERRGHLQDNASFNNAKILFFWSW